MYQFSKRHVTNGTLLMLGTFDLQRLFFLQNVAAFKVNKLVREALIYVLVMNGILSTVFRLDWGAISTSENFLDT